MELLDYRNELLNILEENKNRKVSSVITLINDVPLPTHMNKPKRQNTYLLDKDNNVYAIFCYYHKQWELISETDYGKKSNTKTGLNTMCKSGVRNWTKQQKDSKKQSEALLDQLMNNEVDQEEARVIQEQIVMLKNKITTLDTDKGYSLEEIQILLTQYNEV